MKSVVDSFYSAINTGNNDLLGSLVHENFTLVCPTRDHVLSGVYQTKARFFDDVLPCVFGCVNPDNILFCAEHRILCASEDTVVALAMNKGEALTGKRYDQIYLHVFKCLDGQILTLIESFDTALANQALWGKPRRYRQIKISRWPASMPWASLSAKFWQRKNFQIHGFIFCSAVCRVVCGGT